jgi:hypothetical protein
MALMALTRYVKQPHLIEGGKIYLPLKVN